MRPIEPDYWPPAHRDVVIALDDVLITDGQIAPFDPHQPNFVAMGRYGNVLLANGETNLQLTGAPGEIVRLFRETKKIFDPHNIFNPHKKSDADWDYSFSRIRQSF